MIRVFGIGPQPPLNDILGGPEHERTFIVRSRYGLPAQLAEALTRSYDGVFDQLDPSEALETVVGDLASRGAEREVVYLVPGSGAIGDLTAATLSARTEVMLFPGQFSTPIAASQLQVIDALALAMAEESAPFDGGRVAVDPTTPVLVTNWRGTRVVELATRRLLRIYGHDELPACNAQGELLLPPIDPIDLGRSVSALAQIVAALRAPDGCPWDREQTPQGLAPQLVEEAQELAEALLTKGAAEQVDEMGDVLLHLMLLSQVGREAGTFAFEDVVAAVSAKMVRRHPHVFGGLEVASVDEVLANWQRIKAEERAEAGR